MSADRDKEQSFLARWSQRKRGIAGGGGGASDEQPALGRATAGEKLGADAAEPQPIDLSKLPKIEDLLPESDITAFLQKGVPDELKRMALRKAWSLDPAIRDFVEMAENQYDWNVPGGVPGFGDLAAGTDIKALLAQATGQLLAPAAPEQQSEVAGARPSEPVAVPVADASKSGGASEPSPAIEPAAQSPGPLRVSPPKPDDLADIAAADVSADETRNAVPETTGRRRHGGALPRMA